jgi:hypothetical protein
VIDGYAVSSSNAAAYRAARALLALDGVLRPDELGSPWEFASDSVVTFIKDHDDHLHVGFGEGP